MYKGFFSDGGTVHWQGYYFYGVGIASIEFRSLRKGRERAGDIAIDEVKVTEKQIKIIILTPLPLSLSTFFF